MDSVNNEASQAKPEMDPSDSVFQQKYNDFVDDLLGALPEYTADLQAALSLEDGMKLQRFQQEVNVQHTLRGSSEDFTANPCTILPGVTVAEPVWAILSDATKKAIWEHVRVLSICCYMEAGFNEQSKPSWMEDAMNEMKKKMEGVDFQDIIKKFMRFMNPGASAAADAGAADAGAPGAMPGLEGMFANGFPKLPERFLKGHLARLSQEIVKDITPGDLGISPEMIKECEKDPSRAFTLLFSTFSNNPDIIQKTIARIGNRLQHKVQTGVIRPQEIAREAEELMKEFAGNDTFVEMMNGIKSAFGMEDMDMARKAGKEGTARMSIARDRLRKKLDKKKEAASSATGNAPGKK
uniref:Uncharacterized protein n=1 Tax=viral metagenome TaxID=1070528 RepID=A0A6C0IIK6_9ZZZZ